MIVRRRPRGDAHSVAAAPERSFVHQAIGGVYVPTFTLSRFLCAPQGAALAASGCPHTHDADSGHADHGGDHAGPEEKTDALTVYSDRHELFIEHPFLLAGKPTRFVTHVTDVQARKARASGPVSFVLQLGDEAPSEQLVPEVARLGIYLPELTFPRAGTWKVALRIPVEGGHDLVPLPPRRVYASQAELDAAPALEEVDGISFLKEQQWKLDFQTAPVLQETLVERIQLPGRLIAPPAGRAQATSPVAGRLTRAHEGALPRLGQRVEAGQILARVRPPLAGSDHLTFLTSRQELTALRLELQTKAREAEAAAERATLSLRHAEHVVERVRGLAARQAKSPRELEEAEFERARAAADLATAQASATLYGEVLGKLDALPLDLSEGYPFVELVAPISGVVVAVHAAEGQHISAEAPLFELLDQRVLQLEVRVPEAFLTRLPPEPDALFTPLGRRDAPRPVLGAGGGRLLLGALEVDPRSRSARLVYELPNAAGLAAGQGVEVFVGTREAPNCLSIPSSALVEEEGRQVVFVLIGGESFAKREVQVGVRDGDRVEVRSGLQAGERVVNRGAYAVKLASVSTSIPAHGHAH